MENANWFSIKEGVLTKYNGPSGDIVIPEGVETIGNQVFQNRQIKSVLFPSTLKKIGKESFRECRKLNKIIFPNKLIEIGEEAFHGCERLSLVMFSNNLIKIGDDYEKNDEICICNIFGICCTCLCCL